VTAVRFITGREKAVIRGNDISGSFGWKYGITRCGEWTYCLWAHGAQFSPITINKEVDVMRELTATELRFVSGGGGECSEDSSGNSYGGVADTSSIADDLINIYEGIVEATSYVIERVANAL